MNYGDSRVCKTLAGEFESRTSHQFLVLSSNCRLGHHPFKVKNRVRSPVGLQMLRSTSGLGHHPFKVELSEEGHGFESRTEYKIDGPFVYRSRTPPFHGGEMGSIPVRSTKNGELYRRGSGTDCKSVV